MNYRIIINVKWPAGNEGLVAFAEWYPSKAEAAASIPRAMQDSILAGATVLSVEVEKNPYEPEPEPEAPAKPKAPAKPRTRKKAT